MVLLIIEDCVFGLKDLMGWFRNRSRKSLGGWL